MSRPRHIFQSFWYGGMLTPYEHLCIKSFLDYGHEFHLYTYDPSLRCPTGTVLKDAGEVFNQSAIFTYKNGPGTGSPSAFANLFRYKLLTERGGWWVDTDVICMKPQVPDYDTFFALETTQRVNSAILKFPPSHPVMVKCLEHATTLSDNIYWGQTGPELLTEVLTYAGLLDRAQPSRVAYPIYGLTH